MGVYIKGMEMPSKKNGAVLIIYPDGKCAFEDGKTYQAVPVPPHGRLIDADAMVADLKRQCKEVFKTDAVSPDDFWITRDQAYNERLWTTWCESLYDYINAAPTIIPAEGKGYILAPQEEYDGLKRKYVVLKSDTGECVENCFVLRPGKDKAAIAALLAYADATENQVLAKDIRSWISIVPAEEGET